MLSHTDSWAVCPYPGLRPFRPEEADVFFGRNVAVQRLLGRLSDRRFVAIVGASGTGKTSLILAGLMPALEVGGPAPEQIHSAKWLIPIFRPGNAPIRVLAQALFLRRRPTTKMRYPRLKTLCGTAVFRSANGFRSVDFQPRASCCSSLISWKDYSSCRPSLTRSPRSSTFCYRRPDMQALAFMWQLHCAPKVSASAPNGPRSRRPSTTANF